MVRLREARDRAAGELGLDPALVASRSVLEQVLGRIDQRRDPAGAEDLREWQHALLRPAIEAERS
jgi:hypothetical protein